MYTVINPIISSSNKSVVKEVDDLKAAQKLYEMMSASFDGNNQNFAFTVQKLNAKNEIGKGKVENYKTYVVQEKLAELTQDPNKATTMTKHILENRPCTERVNLKRTFNRKSKE